MQTYLSARNSLNSPQGSYQHPQPSMWALKNYWQKPYHVLLKTCIGWVHSVATATKSVFKYMKHGSSSDAVWWTVWSEFCSCAAPPSLSPPYLLIQLHTGPQAVGLVSVHNYLFTHCPKPPRIIGSTPRSFGKRRIDERHRYTLPESVAW